jgi:hypothetical protein
VRLHSSGKDTSPKHCSVVVLSFPHKPVLYCIVCKYILYVFLHWISNTEGSPKPEQAARPRKNYFPLRGWRGAYVIPLVSGEI